jgi:Cd2+/Zn2+-exporting ATPase
VAIVAAISNAARRGVLIKGGVHLEEMGSISAVAFDKTGTLTVGRPAVTDLVSLGGAPASAVLADAAGVERHSEHPLAGAVVRAAKEQRLAIPDSTGFEAAFGIGASASIGTRRIRIGGLRLFPEADGLLPAKVAALEDEGKTVLVLGDEAGPYGLIAVADEVRRDAPDVVARLRRAGISHVAVLTGDNERVAASVCRIVGCDRFEANLLPQDKVGAVNRLLADYGKVAMVGDGVNDAPALATATVGIAMGGAGSDTALETADVALLSDDLAQLPYTVALSRAALGTIRWNISFSLAVKLIAVLAVFPGWLTLWLAVLADMGASVLVTLNGIRLLHLGGQDRRVVRPCPSAVECPP